MCSLLLIALWLVSTASLQNSTASNSRYDWEIFQGMSILFSLVVSSINIIYSNSLLFTSILHANNYMKYFSGFIIMSYTSILAHSATTER